MPQLVENHTRDIQYCRADDGKWVDPDYLRSLRPHPRIEDVEAYLSGRSDLPCLAGSYLPIAGLCTIPPKTMWRVDRNQYDFVRDLRSFEVLNANLESTISSAYRLLTQTNNGNYLGVELSGGLDTSIIIEFLSRWQIPFALIGMRSDRYEFRTEREVQMFYADRCPTVRLYSGNDIPAFSRLDEVPPHPLPTMGSLNFAHAQKRAELCRDLGVKTLLSGDAGDMLLSLAAPRQAISGRVPNNWAYWNLAQSIWTDQYVFKPIGVRFVSGLAVGRIPGQILHLRSGLKEDRMKLWARNKLNSYLPDMLSKHAYKAFHDGWISEGIVAAIPAITKMAYLAFNAVPHPALSPEKIEKSAINFAKLNADSQNSFLMALSFIIWVYSHNR